MRGKKKQSSFEKALFALGAFIARARMTFMEGFYSAHVRIRYVHDKTYAKGGIYKKWSDKPYSRAVHKAALLSFIISFILLNTMSALFPYLFNPAKPQIAKAGRNTVTWNSRGEFLGNTFPTGAATSALSRSNVEVSGVNDGDDATVTAGPAELNTWSVATDATGILGRAFYSSVWTGTNMVIWGGSTTSAAYNQSGLIWTANGTTRPTGSACAASSGCWDATSTTGAPEARKNHSAVWTGTHMVVWGGFSATWGDGTAINTGGIWTPNGGTRPTGAACAVAGGCWDATASPGSSNGQSLHTAVWTGTQMIVWGGFYHNAGVTTNYNYGKVWTPNGTGGCAVAGGCWTGTTLTEAPAGRQNHTAVWTGSRMVIWGGYNGTTELASGGIYDPVGNSWVATTTGGSTPSARGEHTAIWTGSKMIIWGGEANSLTHIGQYSTGAAWSANGTNGCAVAGGCWAAVSNTGAPSARSGHTATWTGTKMVVFGGYLETANGCYDADYMEYYSCPVDNKTGKIYDPSSDTWSSLSGTFPSSERYGHTAVFVNTNIVIFGGVKHATNPNESDTYLGTGGLLAGAYPISSSISGFRIDSGSGKKNNWSTISWNPISQNAGTTVKFQTRGTNIVSPDNNTLQDQANPDNGWTAWADVLTSGASITTTSTRWLDIKLVMTSDGTNYGQVGNFDVNFDTLDAPSNNNLTIKNNSNGSLLKKSNGQELQSGQAVGYSNETTLILEGDQLTCGTTAQNNLCAGTSLSRKPEVEIKTIDTPFAANPVQGVDTILGTSTVTSGEFQAGYVTLSNLAVGSSYHIRVRTTDGSGKVSDWTSYGGNTDNPAGTSDADIVIDQVAPEGAISEPDYGEVYNAASWQGYIQGSATDNASGVQKVELQFRSQDDEVNPTETKYWNKDTSQWVNDPVWITGIEGTASWTYSFVAGSLRDGKYHIIDLRVYDNAGNYRDYTDEISFLYDNTAPIGSLLINGVNDASVYTPNTRVDLTFPGASTDIQSIWVSNSEDMAGDEYNNGTDGAWVNFETPFAWYLMPSDGVKTVYVKFRDRALNESPVYNASIKYDGSAPDTSIENPTNSAFLRNATLTSLSGTIAETGSGISGASSVRIAVIHNGLYWNGLIFDADTNARVNPTTLTGNQGSGYAWSYTVPLSGVWTDGSYTVKVDATDAAGQNEPTPAEISFILDNVGPTTAKPAWSAHNEDDFYSDNTATFTWSATDPSGNSGITAYSYAIDTNATTTPDTVVEAVGDVNSPSALVNINDDGTQYFHVRSKDGAGNWGSANHLRFRIDRQSPTTGTFTASGTDKDKITLSWSGYSDAGSGLKEYKLYKYSLTYPVTENPTDPGAKPVGGSWSLLDTIAHPTAEFVDTVPSDENAQWTYYKMIAYDNSNPAKASSELESHSKPNIKPYIENFNLNGAASNVEFQYADTRNLTATWDTYDTTTASGRDDIVTTQLLIKKQDGAGNTSTFTTIDQNDARMTREDIVGGSGGYRITVNLNELFPKESTDFGNYQFIANTIDTISEVSHQGVSSGLLVKLAPATPGLAFGNPATPSTSEVNLVLSAPNPSNGLRATNRYGIWRKAEGGVYSEVALTNSLTYTDANLTAATRYYYKIRAYDIGGFDLSGNFSQFSAEINVLTPSPAAPPDNDLFALIDISSGDQNHFLLTWDLPVANNDPDVNTIDVEVKEYVIDRAINGTWTNGYGTSKERYFYDSENLSGVNDYSYRVRTKDANDQVGVPANSAVRTGRPGSKPIVTPLPGKDFPTTISTSTATFEWKADQSAESQIVYSANQSDLTNANAKPKVAGVGGYRAANSETHTVRIADLTPGTTYYYKIMSRNSAGRANDFEIKSFKTTSFVINHNNKDTSQVVTNTENVTIKFNTNGDPDMPTPSKGSIIYGVSENNTVTGIKEISLPELKSTGVHEITLPDLLPGKSYGYQIKAVDASDYTIYNPVTGWFYFTTKAYDSTQFTIAPNASDIAQENITATSAKIVWNTAIATDSCVEYGTESVAPGEKYPQSACDPSYNTVHVIELKNLTPGTTYFYRVKGQTPGNQPSVFSSKEYKFTAVLQPEIRNIKVSVTSPYTARVTFSTNVDTEASLSYGKDGQYSLKAGNTEIKRDHVIELTDLEDASVYNLYIEVRDQLKNNIKSSEFRFETPLDREGPKIGSIKVEMLPLGDNDETAQAIISWTTDKPSSTKIEYDEGAIGDKFSKSSVEDATLSPSHTVIIKELSPATTYRYRIVSKDKRGNVTTSKAFTFVTPAKEKSVLQLIIRSLEETFSWMRNMGAIFRRR